jgi:hypothetical protein
MRTDLCFDAATEGATGGMQVSCPPVVVAKLQDWDTPKDTPCPCSSVLLVVRGSRVRCV